MYMYPASSASEQVRVVVFQCGVIQLASHKLPMLLRYTLLSGCSGHSRADLLGYIKTHSIMAPTRNIYVAAVGVGGVGKCFLSQLEALSHRTLSHPSAPTRISLIAIGRSSKSLLREYHDPIPFQNWQSALHESTAAVVPMAQLADFLAKAPGPAVLVDNTSDQTTAESYPLFLTRGISVITANKKAFSGSIALWDAIFSAAANGTGPADAGYVFHESSVGACLPVISTLKDLVETGDVVTKIEGVFSGTMSFLFNGFMPVGGGGGSFSAEVKNAKDLGYTEPDPRDDLNGLDVARKLTILARLSGLRVESPTSFPVQSLIPEELESVGSGEEFVARLHEFDAQSDAIKKEAAAEDKVLRYVGSIDLQAGQLEVGLRKFDTSHPIAALKGSDNIISFHTKRYGPTPLIVQGAGAGGDPTAMGVAGDFLRVMRAVQYR